MIVAGQTFHWFQLSSARREFIRIPDPDGWVALIWNDRRANEDAFAWLTTELGRLQVRSAFEAPRQPRHQPPEDIDALARRG